MRVARIDLHHDVIEDVAERATLVRRMGHVKRTRPLFELWHVFHMPLVYIMFAIVVVHVAVDEANAARLPTPRAARSAMMSADEKSFVVVPPA